MMRSLKLLLSVVFLLTSLDGAALARDTHKHKKGTTEQTAPKTHVGKSVFKDTSKGKNAGAGKNVTVATNHKGGHRKKQY